MKKETKKKEVKKEVKRSDYYLCDDCGCKETIDESEEYQGYGLCWDCYVSEEWGTGED